MRKNIIHAIYLNSGWYVILNMCQVLLLFLMTVYTFHWPEIAMWLCLTSDRRQIISFLIPRNREEPDTGIYACNIYHTLNDAVFQIKT